MSRSRRGGAALCCALLLLTAGGANAVPPLLDELGRTASLTVFGRIVAVSEHAEGALRTYGVEPLTVLRGESPDSFAVLEERPTGPPWAATGETRLFLLTRAPAHSFYRKHLPAGSIFVPVAVPAGVIGLEPDALPIAAAVLAAPLPEEGEGADLELVGRELRSGHPELALDGVRRLVGRAAPDVALDRGDLAALGACLGDPRVGETAKQELARWLGARPETDARRVLQSWQPDRAGLRAERTEALARHGAKPDPTSSARLLRDPDPELRQLGVREVAVEPTEANLRSLGVLALGDPDPAVRIAAIEGLGRSGSDQAVSILQRTFESGEPDQRRASAQALRGMDDDQAAAAFVDLVLYAESFDVQRHALMLLLAQGVERDDPRMERIVREHPDDRIRTLLTDGIQPDPH